MIEKVKTLARNFLRMNELKKTEIISKLNNFRQKCFIILKKRKKKRERSCLKLGERKGIWGERTQKKLVNEWGFVFLGNENETK